MANVILNDTKFKNLMTNKLLTVAALAEEINVSTRLIMKMRKGEPVSMRTAQKVCNYFKIEPEKMIKKGV